LKKAEAANSGKRIYFIYFSGPFGRNSVPDASILPSASFKVASYGRNPGQPVKKLINKCKRSLTKVEKCIGLK
jgi:hypothetical protein